jgi:hypothetical protein
VDILVDAEAAFKNYAGMEQIKDIAILESLTKT